MPTIRELINANVQTTLAAIAAGVNYTNTVGGVEWWKVTGNPPRYTDLSHLFIALYDGPDDERESSPISKDDYDAVIVAEVYHAQAIASLTTASDRNASAWADLKKALLIDRGRGTFPATTYPLAFNTKLGPPKAFDVAGFQGFQADIRIWYRTAIGNPYAQ